MGSATVQMIEAQPDLELASTLVRGQSLAESLDRSPCDVLVDFTHFDSAVDHGLVAMQRGIAPVIGVSGIDPSGIERLRSASLASGVPCAVIPNFALGAVLLMKFAEMAAPWMPHVEILELHHDGKKDAPSGTAMALASRLAKARGETPPQRDEILKAECARGAEVAGIRVHSVRLPGLVAHNEVLFGGTGELLTLRHDSLSRESFMSGVALAVRQIRSRQGLSLSLDELMS